MSSCNSQGRRLCPKLVRRRGGELPCLNCHGPYVFPATLALIALQGLLPSTAVLWSNNLRSVVRFPLPLTTGKWRFVVLLAGGCSERDLCMKAVLHRPGHGSLVCWLIVLQVMFAHQKRTSQQQKWRVKMAAFQSLIEAPNHIEAQVKPRSA